MTRAPILAENERKRNGLLSPGTQDEDGQTRKGVMWVGGDQWHANGILGYNHHRLTVAGPSAGLPIDGRGSRPCLHPVLGSTHEGAADVAPPGLDPWGGLTAEANRLHWTGGRTCPKESDDV